MNRRSSGDPELDRHIAAILDHVGARSDRDLLFEILASGAGLADGTPDRLDLKITAAALQEMREAFVVFAGWRDTPKVTIFGSARTQPHDPLYRQARDIAQEMAERGWMVVTGAGPGIMAAGMEGAGRDRSLGVSIRLPFEERANAIIEGDPKLVATKYFFTRKLMLMKESSAFVALPGGFGTLDETFELLTLQQTGKSVPAPIVLLDTPGGAYWEGWEAFVQDRLTANGLISEIDEALYLITDDVAAARREILGFYRNYDSIRWVGTTLVIRLKIAPTEAEVGELNERFSALCIDGGPIRTTEPLGPEVSSKDKLELPRLAMPFDSFQMAGLRELIDAINRLGSAAGSEA